ncbi:MAG: carbamate kinase [Nitrososphaerota archaeon]|nr:carbamate kinase [Nitrososphaerota archaeon]
MVKRILIALGGNAIKRANEEGTTEEQFRNIAITCEHIARLLKRLDEDDRIVITHGNGPQIGNLLIQQEEGSKFVPPQTLDVLCAMTQGQIGYMIQQTLQRYLRDVGGRWAKGQVVSIINQVLVSLEDPDFLDPSKPIGNFLTKDEVERLVREKGFVVDPPPGRVYLDKKISGLVIKRVMPMELKRPFRRVVPSPEPIKNIEADLIKMMVDQGVIVIASGGGGIPVVMDKDGNLKGVFAVIDKDKASEKLAEAIDATEFIILTDVEYVMLNFGRPNEKPIYRMSVEEAERYLAEGHFAKGSMEPKIIASIRFLRWGGERAIISSLDKLVEAYEGKTGTHIYR